MDEGTAALVLREVGLTEAGARAALKGMRGEGSLAPDPESKLAKQGRVITRLAREGKLDPVMGREDEIKRMLQILARHTKNNSALIGEPGVAKTAIVEGLAQKMARGYVPEVLKDKTIVALELDSFVAGTKFRGEFEERLKRVMDEVAGSHGKLTHKGAAAVEERDYERTTTLRDEAERLLAIEEALHERVIGQDAAVVAVSETVRKARRPREPQPSHRPLHLLGTHWGR